MCQKDDANNEYVVAFGSRLLKGAEVHYGISEKEALAVVWAVKYYRIYVYGTKFLIVTDHSALAWLMNIQDATGRLARWAIYLQAYEFDIIHRSGRIHSNADTLSRPVLAVTLRSGKQLEPDQDDNYITQKSLDIYEDGNLLHYLRNGSHTPGLPYRQVKRIEKQALNYKIENENGIETVFIKKNDSYKIMYKSYKVYEKGYTGMSNTDFLIKFLQRVVVKPTSNAYLS